jgi:Cu/Ag efflux protein CusF
MKKLLSIAAAITFAANMLPAFGEQTTHTGLGMVQSLDRAKGEITVKHDPISSLNWPAMTMAFQVKEDRLFDRLQTGKRVAFEFVASDNRYVVTSVIPLADQSSTTAPVSEQAHHRGMGMMMGSGAMQTMMDNCMAMMKH